MNGSALYLNLCESCYRTGRGAVVRLVDIVGLTCSGLGSILYVGILGIAIIVKVIAILANTGTGAIDITAMQPVQVVDIGCSYQSGSSTFYICLTNLTAQYLNMGVTAYVTILTATIDRA